MKTKSRINQWHIAMLLGSLSLILSPSFSHCEEGMDSGPFYIDQTGRTYEAANGVLGAGGTGVVRESGTYDPSTNRVTTPVAPAQVAMVQVTSSTGNPTDLFEFCGWTPGYSDPAHEVILNYNTPGGSQESFPPYTMRFALGVGPKPISTVQVEYGGCNMTGYPIPWTSSGLQNGGVVAVGGSTSVVSEVLAVSPQMGYLMKRLKLTFTDSTTTTVVLPHVYQSHPM